MSEDKPFEFIPNKKQALFLSTNADVCLMGGGLGSGKTLAAVILLLRLNDPTGPGYMNPRYNALICRKHYKDLRDIISKTKLIYPKIDPGCTFHSGDLIWRFSSGAMIQIAHFDNVESCTTMVQGAEYCTIIMDEAMHWETDEVFLYLMSRLRNPFGMKGLMRLTSNPGKFPWLRQYFRIDDVGNSTDFIKEYVLDDGTVVKKRIKYIQAKLQDNPHLPKEYQATIMMMSEEDKLALLDGMWNAYQSIRGQVLEHELKRINAENRYCHIAHDPSQPVYTFWDIGSSDMTVILFVQFIGKEIRIIDMIKDNNKGLNDYYMPEVMKRKDDLGYRYKGHYMPHDSGKREWTSNVKIIDQARKVTNDVMRLPQDNLASGLQSMKTMCANVWINKSKCEELYNDLTHYRREYDDDLGIYSDKPVHDKHSHSADAFRYISYYKPVQEIDVDEFYSNRHR